MGEGFQFLDVILFAMVAAFLVLRLRSVLGKRTGHQQHREDGISRSNKQSNTEDNVVELSERKKKATTSTKEGDDQALSDDKVGKGLQKIQTADPSFEATEFLEGAQNAFELIVESFANSDTDTLENLLEKDVFENFRDAILEREKMKETLETTIISFKSAKIIEANMEDNNAIITIEYKTEQINVTRDSEDRVIEGDPNQVMEITDIWSFIRDAGSIDPNWKLVETRSQN